MWKAVLRGALDLVAPHLCPGCDEKLEWGEQGFCEACCPLLDPMVLGPACYEYGGPLAEAIRKLKYQRRVDLAAPLADLWLPRASQHLGEVDVVVPVPLHPKRQRERGLHWVALLAEPLAKGLGVPLHIQRLRRTRDTAVQASMSRVDRDSNVRGAFAAERDGARPRVLLVDDVRTTGATLKAATAALYRAGATRVRVMALAGVDPT